MLEAALIAAAVILVMIGLARVQQRDTSEILVYRCNRCAREFRQQAHLDFPRACPHCHATDWAT